MKVPVFPLPRNLREARQIQEGLQGKVKLRPLKVEEISQVVGADVAYLEDRGYACILLFSFPSLKIREEIFVSGKVKFPYIPGYFAFREIPILLEGFKKLKENPDLIFVDAHGIAHPRRVGMATHLGVILDIPTIGCAKRILKGKHPPLPLKRGSWVWIKEGEEVVGIALRSRENCRPIFLSPGYKVDFFSTLKITLMTLSGYRIPEVLRLPHLYLRKRLKEIK